MKLVYANDSGNDMGICCEVLKDSISVLTRPVIEV